MAMTTIAINRSPCQSCPYRQDVPSGIWEAAEYDKIIPYDNPTWAQPPKVFLCHQADGCLCRGWLDTHGDQLLGLRLACSKGEVDPEASAAEAAEHGRKSIKRPGRKAREMVAKIERKRGKE